MAKAQRSRIVHSGIGNIDAHVCAFTAEDVVLDTGTGGGYHLDVLCSRCKRVYATDINSGFLGTIRDGVTHDNLALAQADLRTMPFRSSRFTRVICTEVLEHLSDPADAIAELHRMLGADGVAVVSVPTYFSERLYARLNRRYDQNRGEHITILRKNEWVCLFNTAGFAIVAVRNRNHWPALYWTFRNIVPVEYDAASGHVPGDRRLDRLFWLITGAIDRLTLGVAGRFGATIFPKSWYFYLTRIDNAH